MSLHAVNKFREWASRVEQALERKDHFYGDHSLKYQCGRLIHWSNGVKENSISLYENEIRAQKDSLIFQSLPIIYDEYNQYLLESEKHSKYTKVKQKKIMRFVYNFTKYLLPLAEEVGDHNFSRERISRFLVDYLPDVLFDLSNLDEYEINSLLDLLNKADNLGIDDVIPMKAIVEVEILDRKLEGAAQKDLEGESEQVEFKIEIPENIHKLAKEIAGFASTKGGRIYLGVDDEANIVGLDERKFSYDQFQQRVAGITKESVKPPLSVNMNQCWIGGKMIVQIEVAKGTDPVYYVKHIPYVRVFTTTRPATPQEVKKLHLHHFIDQLQRSTR